MWMVYVLIIVWIILVLLGIWIFFDDHKPANKEMMDEIRDLEEEYDRLRNDIWKED